MFRNVNFGEEMHQKVTNSDKNSIPMYNKELKMAK